MCVMRLLAYHHRFVSVFDDQIYITSHFSSRLFNYRRWSWCALYNAPLIITIVFHFDTLCVVLDFPSPEIERSYIPRLPIDIMHSVRNKSPDIGAKKCIFDLKQLGTLFSTIIIHINKNHRVTRYAI